MGIFDDLTKKAGDLVDSVKDEAKKLKDEVDHFPRKTTQK